MSTISRNQVAIVAVNADDRLYGASPCRGWREQSASQPELGDRVEVGANLGVVAPDDTHYGFSARIGQWKAQSASRLETSDPVRAGAQAAVVGQVVKTPSSFMASRYAAWLKSTPLGSAPPAPPRHPAPITPTPTPSVSPSAVDARIADILARSDREMRTIAAEMAASRLRATQANMERWTKVSDTWLTAPPRKES